MKVLLYLTFYCEAIEKTTDGYLKFANKRSNFTIMVIFETWN